MIISTPDFKVIWLTVHVEHAPSNLTFYSFCFQHLLTKYLHHHYLEMVEFPQEHFRYYLLMFFSFYLLTAEQPAIVVIFSISEGGKSLFFLPTPKLIFRNLFES